MTPEELATAVRDLRDALGRTIMCHPVNVAALEEWRRTATLGAYITIVPVHYIPHDKLYVMPTSIIERPVWLR